MSKRQKGGKKNKKLRKEACQENWRRYVYYTPKARKEEKKKMLFDAWLQEWKTLEKKFMGVYEKSRTKKGLSELVDQMLRLSEQDGVCLNSNGKNHLRCWRQAREAKDREWMAGILTNIADDIKRKTMLRKTVPEKMSSMSGDTVIHGDLYL